MVLSAFWVIDFSYLFMILEIDLESQQILITWRDGIYTNGKSVENIRVQIENYSFDEHEPEIS